MNCIYAFFTFVSCLSLHIFYRFFFICQQRERVHLYTNRNVRIVYGCGALMHTSMYSMCCSRMYVQYIRIRKERTRYRIFQRTHSFYLFKPGVFVHWIQRRKTRFTSLSSTSFHFGAKGNGSRAIVEASKNSYQSY